MTALGGLPLYMDLGKVMGLTESIGRHVKVREGGQGWTDVQMITALVMLNLAGGEHVDDLGVLEGDEGFCNLVRRVELAGMKRKERREMEKRWRKEKKRAVPSASAVFRYLAGFHEEEERVAGKAIIPRSNEHLQGLQRVNEELVGQLQKHEREKLATLDMDATLVATHKAEALYCYKHYQAYQPLNTYWAEAGVVLHSEFRDGNVPAGYEQLRVFQAALESVPAGVETVRLRSDTAGYQHDLLRYCELGENERFGRIEFAISSDVTAEFKKAVCGVRAEEWRPIYRQERGQKVRTEREWAEVCFVPNKMAQKKGLSYRYMATREAMAQLELPGVEEQRELPFQTVVLREQRYKVFGMVTNMKGDGGELVVWQQERCGKSEEVHKVMKEDLAGGTLPSGDFGENAAWWAIMVLSLNLNVMMKRLVLGEGWAGKRMKAIRFHLICLPGRMVQHARGLVVKLTRRCAAYDFILQARRRMVELALSG
jgi:hypothetical protein